MINDDDGRLAKAKITKEKDRHFLENYLKLFKHNKGIFF